MWEGTKRRVLHGGPFNVSSGSDKGKKVPSVRRSKTTDYGLLSTKYVKIG